MFSVYSYSLFILFIILKPESGLLSLVIMFWVNAHVKNLCSLSLITGKGCSVFASCVNISFLHLHTTRPHKKEGGRKVNLRQIIYHTHLRKVRGELL